MAAPAAEQTVRFNVFLSKREEYQVKLEVKDATNAVIKNIATPVFKRSADFTFKAPMTTQSITFFINRDGKEVTSVMVGEPFDDEPFNLDMAAMEANQIWLNQGWTGRFTDFSRNLPTQNMETLE
jgi:hypothetical protein